jgi:hypothetical protein
MRKSAVAVKSIKEAKGVACLYKLSEPLVGYEYVVVSAARDASNNYEEQI